MLFVQFTPVDIICVFFFVMKAALFRPLGYIHAFDLSAPPCQMCLTVLLSGSDLLKGLEQCKT